MLPDVVALACVKELLKSICSVPINPKRKRGSRLFMFRMSKLAASAALHAAATCLRLQMI